MTERAVLLGESGSVVGVVTEAAGPSSAGPPPAVVLINVGVTHHVGPHRLYVDLARRLASLGFDVLRFDHSGVGDSGFRDDNLPFEESSILEVQQALDWLSRERGSRRFVLVGLCSGTLTAFRTASRDPRVVGLGLLTALLEDPSSVSEAAVREAAERRVARSYLSEKAFDWRSWKKFLAGRANYRRIARALARSFRSRFASKPPGPAARSEVVRKLAALLERGVRVSFIFSEPTTVLEYFRMTIEPALGELREIGEIDLHVLERSDHTFTEIRHRRRALDLVVDWIAKGEASAKAPIDARMPAASR